MPMLDLFIPDGALTPDAEAALIDDLTTFMLKIEGADPTNPFAREIGWAYVHRSALYVGGSPSAKPRYRILASVPQGNINGADRKAEIVSYITSAVLRAEGGDGTEGAERVWVFPLEIPEGHWGGAGQVFGLEQLFTLTTGDPTRAASMAQKRLSANRAERDQIGRVGEARKAASHDRVP
ncbi:hypothetical protein [Gordonia hydrophobica]|uniref:Tautomerase enzyme n=1 Tax=Gordonia hydrophobica TaxID=40516 RepID=A0ABZ2U6B8_9ACTN|nr:hypothetical protein [Gordonia hydrophobica]MBM7365630.1 phenylpyruvate tautomerase PptA (4-oxalocrotonate tautomerase family) [Gordonia hydrophobica]